jgi:hypothetical protein
MKQVVKSLYVEIKREEYDAMRATIEQQAARITELQADNFSLKNPQANVEVRKEEVAEAVALQRVLLSDYQECRPSGLGLMGWAEAALKANARGGVVLTKAPRTIVTEALINMVEAVTGMKPPTGTPPPPFIQSAIDRTVERLNPPGE